MVEPSLSGGTERVCLTPEGKVGGFRRVYSDWADFAFTGRDWPHTSVHSKPCARSRSGRWISAGIVSLTSSNIAGSQGVALRAIRACGNVLDLATEDGLLILRMELSAHRKAGWPISHKISGNPRLVGDVLVGDDVCAASDAIIIGSGCHRRQSQNRAGRHHTFIDHRL